MKSTPFGNYIRAMRVAAKRSLRQVAEELGITHVYLGEVERGQRGPLKEEHWESLVRFVPEISVEKLREFSTRSKPISIPLENATPKYQELGLALAQRIKKQDLPEETLAKLLELLGAEREE